MKYHPITKTIILLLKQENCWFESFEHLPVRTSLEAVLVRPEYSLHQGAKALIVRVIDADKEKKFIMLVFPADRKFSTKKLKTAFKIKDVRFATEEEVENITSGVQVGGVPPFGNLFGLLVIADPELFKNEKIVFNAGDRSFSIAMKSENYKKLVGPKIVEITES